MSAMLDLQLGENAEEIEGRWTEKVAGRSQLLHRRTVEGGEIARPKSNCSDSGPML